MLKNHFVTTLTYILLLFWVEHYEIYAFVSILTCPCVRKFLGSKILLAETFSNHVISRKVWYNCVGKGFNFDIFEYSFDILEIKYIYLECIRTFIYSNIHSTNLWGTIIFGYSFFNYDSCWIYSGIHSPNMTPSIMTPAEYIRNFIRWEEKKHSLRSARFSVLADMRKRIAEIINKYEVQNVEFVLEIAKLGPILIKYC